MIGFAETATGLGHGVAAVSAADSGPAPYLHTTRRPAPDGARVIRFSEEHSHAVDQSLIVLDDAELRGGRPLVLVDDELTTGKTAVNAIRVLQASWPRPVYVLASLLDCRSDECRAEVAQAVGELGADVVSVSLLDGRVRLPAGVLARAGDFIAALPQPPAQCSAAARRSGQAAVSWLEVALPDAVPANASTGWGPDQAVILHDQDASGHDRPARVSAADGPHVRLDRGRPPARLCLQRRRQRAHRRGERARVRSHRARDRRAAGPAHR